MNFFSKIGLLLLDMLGFLFSSVYVPNKIYWGLPAAAIVSSFFFFFSSEVTKLFLGNLGAIFLALYGITILAVRIKNFGK
ncbi:MAG: hypothetical protein WAZ96_00310 [Candidatus Moraniibacteriota bacterium]